MSTQKPPFDPTCAECITPDPNKPYMERDAEEIPYLPLEPGVVGWSDWAAGPCRYPCKKHEFHSARTWRYNPKEKGWLEYGGDWSFQPLNAGGPVTGRHYGEDGTIIEND